MVMKAARFQRGEEEIWLWAQPACTPHALGLLVWLTAGQLLLLSLEGAETPQYPHWSHQASPSHPTSSLSKSHGGLTQVGGGQAATGPLAQVGLQGGANPVPPVVVPKGLLAAQGSDAEGEAQKPDGHQHRWAAARQLCGG